MIKSISLLILTLSLVSCLSKGDQNVAANSVPQDITISLLKISPPSVVIGASETAQFTVIGGNAPYTYVVSSGFGSVNQAGLYTAPAGLGTNTIKATDAGGNSVFAVVTVGNSLQVSPASKTMGTSQSTTLSAIAGVAPYTFSIASGAGSINASTGFFTSDATSGVVSIQLQDSIGNNAYATINVVDALTIAPNTITIEDMGTYSFLPAGGSSPYTYQVYAGSGFIDAFGDYTAPAVGGTDIIRITDSNSIFVEATVTIALGPNVSATNSTLTPGQTTTVSSSEGTAPFVYTVESGSGSIDGSTGVFTAPSVASSTVIRATDANGFYDELTVQTENLKKMAMGDNYTCMLHVKNDNITSDFKCWGLNAAGELGQENAYIGDAVSEMGDNLTTLDFGAGNTPVRIYANNYYTKCALFSNGKMKCWGDGNQGKTGTGSTTDRGRLSKEMGSFLPFADLGTGVTVTADLSIDKRISMGSETTCVAIDDDTIKCLGDGAQGRSGNGTQTDYCSAASNCGDNVPVMELGVGKSLVQIVAGHESTCAIIAPDNKVKCWGYGRYGQLGTGATANVIQKPKDIGFVDLGTGRTAQMITSGYYHKCALLDDNTIKCWGYNSHGQLGVGTNQHQGDDALEMGDNLGIADMGSVSFPIGIYAKGYSTCAVFNNGGLKCWGYNAYGNLGLGNTAHRGDGAGEMGDSLPFVDVGSGETVTSIDLSDRTTCVVTSANNLKCWGDNTYGQLGIGNVDRIGNGAGEMGDNLTVVNLGTGKVATHIAVSIYSTCAFLNDSTVKCWGRDDQGSLGLESVAYGDHPAETPTILSNIDLGTGAYAKEISSGRYHVCVILMDDSTKCFGTGGQGRLGYGNQNNLGDDIGEMGDALLAVDLGAGLNATQIAASNNATCAVLNSGDVKCWGDGANGRRGSGDQVDRGDGAGEMGDNLDIVSLGGGVTAKSVGRGNGFTCIVDNSDKVKCWGYNLSGRLGIGNATQTATSAGTVPDTYANTDLGTGRTVKQLSVGYEHSCVILDNDKIKCWGEGNYGRLGSESTADLGDSPAEMGDGLPYVDLGTGETAKMISTGIYHSCALLNSGKIKCWGYNTSGQLGNGSTATIGDGASEMGDNLVEVILSATDKPKAIYSAGYHNCAVMESNAVKCWGNNTYGQLGHGHRYNVGGDPLSMGSNLPVSH